MQNGTNTDERKIIHLIEYKDVLEVGTPGKGGAIKVYGDFKDVKGFKDKIANAVEVRKYAQANIDIV